MAVGNRAAFTAYAGESMTDPTQAARLSTLTIPTVVLWGASDQIVDVDYGCLRASDTHCTIRTPNRDRPFPQ